jgi:hypothetical protein
MTAILFSTFFAQHFPAKTVSENQLSLARWMSATLDR